MSLHVWAIHRRGETATKRAGDRRLPALYTGDAIAWPIWWRQSRALDMFVPDDDRPFDSFLSVCLPSPPATFSIPKCDDAWRASWASGLVRMFSTRPFPMRYWNWLNKASCGDSLNFACPSLDSLLTYCMSFHTHNLIPRRQFTGSRTWSSGPPSHLDIALWSTRNDAEFCPPNRDIELLTRCRTRNKRENLFIQPATLTLPSQGPFKHFSIRPGSPFNDAEHCHWRSAQNVTWKNLYQTDPGRV